MRSVRRSFCESIGAWVAISGLMLHSGSALAGFDPWAKVRDPAAAKASALVDVLDRDRVSVDPYLQGAAAQQKLNQRCALRLQLVGLDRAQLEQPAFLLADCLAQAPGQYQPAALEAWLAALGRWGRSPLAARGWGAVAMAEFSLDQPDAAARAVTLALESEWEQETRARLFAARAQVLLFKGELDAAIADFWSSMNEAREIETYTLSQWGLGVALDRSRDFPGAMSPVAAASRARFGNAGRTSVLDLETTLLYPSEDEHYYRALGLMVDAAHNAGKAAQVSFLQAAQLMWLQYFDAAPESSPGRPRAAEHLALVRRQLGASTAAE